MSKKAGELFFGLGLLFFVSCTNCDNLQMSRTEVINGVKNVFNSSKPLKGILALELEKVLEIDSLLSNPENPVFFQQVARDSSGNIYLADNQSVSVHKFDQDGKWLQSFSLKGDGPGEFSRMGNLQIGKDQIWIAGDWPLKIARYNNSGGFVSEWQSERFYNFYLETWVVEEDRFLTVTYKQEELLGSPERRRISALLDSDENVVWTYFERSNAGPMILTVGMDSPMQVSFTNPVIISRILHAYSPLNQILYVLYNREYRVELKSLENESLLVVHREHKDVMITEKDRDELIELLAPRMSSQVQEELKGRLPDVFTTISGIIPLNNGCFAVKRVMGVHSVEVDIFDHSGRYLYLIQPSEDVSDLGSLRFFEKTVGRVQHLEDRDVYTEYSVKNLPEIFQ